MAEQTKIEGVYEIKIVQGPALRAFEDIKKRLDDTKGAIRDMNKETRNLVAEEQAINKAIAQTGQATAEQTAALAKNSARRAELNKTLSEAVLTERALSAQSRELANDLSGLTENGLRFRDKMADATTVALQQSGIISELAKRHEQLSGAMEKVDAAMEGNAAQTQALNAALAKGEVTQQQYADEQARLASELTDAKAAQKLLSDEMAKNNAITTQLDQKVGELNKELAAGKITTKQYGESLKAIEAEARKASEGVGQLGSKFDQFVSGQGQQLRSTLGSMALQYIGVQAAINGVINVMGKANQAYIAHEQAAAKVRQTLKSTGDQAGRTFEELDASASKLSANSLFNVDEILDKSTNRLLTYTNIVGDTFDRAQQAAVDMASALGTDLASAAETVGKALGSPLEAMGALSKQGFKFSDEQKQLMGDLMATGRTAEAQAIILDELEEAYAGQAAVLAETTKGTRELDTVMDQLYVRMGAWVNGAAQGFSSALAGILSGLLGLKDPAKELTDQWVAQSAALQDLEQDVSPMLDRYDQLAGRADLNTDEQAELEEIIRKVSLRVPAAVSAFDDYGKALGLNTEAAREFMRVEQERLKYINADAIKEVSKDIDELTAKQKQLERSLQEGGTFMVDGTEYERLDGQLVRVIRRMSDVQAQKFTTPVGLEEANRIIGIQSQKLAEVTGKLDGAKAQMDTLTGAALDAAKGTEDAGGAAASTAGKVETLGEKFARLSGELETAKAARNLLAATDKEGIAQADRNIAAIQKEIDALDGKSAASGRTTKAERDAIEVARQRLQVLDDIAKAEANRARANDTPEQKEVTQATATRDDRVEKAKGDADLLLKIEEEYQASLTEIQTRYAAERFAQRQQAEDDAAKFLASQRAAVARTELDALKQRQDQELVLAAQGGDNLTALMERQQAEREALVQTLRDAEVQKINDTYEAQYAVMDAVARTELDALKQRQDQELVLAAQGGDNLTALMQRQQAERDGLVQTLGASTLELQAQHGAALNALNEQFRLEDEANAQAAGERRLQILQRQNAVELEAAKDLGNALGELASGQLKDQKDVEKALLKILLKSVKAQVQMAIVAATAKEVGTKGFIGLGTAALLTGLLEGLFAGLGSVIEGFAKGGTVPQQRGTVTSTWGRPVRRANGDNVLVTLRTGEKVLNEEQQKRLEAIAGKSIWGEIRLPGHSMTDAMRRMRHGNLIAGYAEGGTVGIVTPRPAPQTVVQNQFVQSMAAYSDRPMFVSVREINDVQGRVTVTENLGSL